MHSSLCCSWCCGTKTPTCCPQRSRRLKVRLRLRWGKAAGCPAEQCAAMHAFDGSPAVDLFSHSPLPLTIPSAAPSPAPRPCCRGILLATLCIAAVHSATLLCLLMPAADYLSNHPLVDKAISPRCVLAEFTNAGPRLALRVSGSSSGSAGLGRQEACQGQRALKVVAASRCPASIGSVHCHDCLEAFS